MAKNKTSPLLQGNLFASTMRQPSQDAFSRQPPQGPGRVGFVVDEVVMGQAFLQVL